MLIAIDLDGVVLDTMKALILTHELDLKLEEITEYDFWKLPKMAHLSKEQIYRMFETIDPNVVSLYPLVKEGLQYLNKQSHYIYFLTNKTNKMLQWTLEVLKRENLEHIPLETTQHKHTREFDILIEDRGATFEKCCRNGKKCVLIDQPWNQQYKAPRFKNLLDCAKWIDGTHV